MRSGREMTTPSVLCQAFDNGVRRETRDVPAIFRDLNLDQVVDAITATKQVYDLKPFYHAPLHAADAVVYRQEVFRDLEQRDVLEAITAFAREIHVMRDYLEQAGKMHYPYQKERWFVEAVRVYGAAVQDLARDLAVLELRSRGLVSFRAYLAAYAGAEPFQALAAETQSLLEELASVRYTLQIKDRSVTVRPFDAEADFSAEITATFAKFRQGAVKDYRAEIRDWPEMNHVEAGVLERVVLFYPQVFGHLDAFCAGHAGYLDGGVAAFDREIQFYVAYLEHMATFRRAGLAFCYPTVSDTDKAVYSVEGFDLALAHKLIAEGAEVVCNDFSLTDPERVIVVTGPNQGGKTTFARTFGQLHYLASLGCPVPGTSAKLFLFDRLLTHFEREETLANLRGKLQDDLVRIHAVLAEATPNSVVILNEIFTSTTLQDAVFLSQRVLERILALDALCVCVTFLDELTTLSEKTTSMVSTVSPENPAVRTFKIIRRPADGLAYALAIAEKYRVTHAALKERLQA